MSKANRKNLANGILSLGVSETDTTWVLQNGYGAGMPAVPFYLTATPFGQLPTIGNSEIVNVTARSGDTLTVTRGAKGTTAKAFDAGAVVANAIYDDEKWTSDNIDWATFAPVVYSTTEQRIGTWIDGKPVYRQVFTGTITVAAGTRYSQELGSNVKEVIGVKGYWYESSSLSNTVDTVRMQTNGVIDGATTILCNKSNNAILFATKSGGGRTNMPFVLIAEYTKTTD